MTRTSAVLLTLTLAACATTAPDADSRRSDALRASSTDPCSRADAPAIGSKIPWFHDDAATALQCARDTDRPVLIDLWAPWCHTCMSMKHTVLLDPGLAALADRFVWLAIDTDRPKNAEIVSTLRPEVWPTFLVVSPDLQVQARYLGSASVAQFREFLGTGERGHVDSRAASGSLAANDPMRLIRDGDRAAMAGDLEVAGRAYLAALEHSCADWPRRPDLLVSTIGVLHRQQDWDGCVRFSLQHMAETGRSASAADFCYYAADCATHVDDAGLRRQIQTRSFERLEALIADATAPMSVDDRSDALRILRELHEAQGDIAAARMAAQHQRSLLDTAARSAADARAASTYNWPRAEVYVYLGEGRALVDELTLSTEALPEDYDPPYRLAWVLLQVGDADKALGPAQRAADLAYGPRKARILRLLAEVHRARGDVDGERRARQDVVSAVRNLPEGMRRPGDLEQAEAELLSITAPTKP
ncbi:MAG: thioredoxin family protein [Pseudomonadota bacterium]